MKNRYAFTLYLYYIMRVCARTHAHALCVEKNFKKIRFFLLTKETACNRINKAAKFEYKHL